MARAGSLVSAIFVLLLLFIAPEKGSMVTEARNCETPSTRFKGLCASDRNCASVCQTEGFPGGHCEGFRRRCFCTKPC